MRGEIVGAVFGFPDMHLHGRAFYEFLTLRKRFFVDTLSWTIPHDDVAEMDQYDNPAARYSVALQDGRVVGGARIMRFSDRWGAHGCMLKDAAEGKIPGIPVDVLPTGRAFHNTAECTRLVLSDSFTSNEERREALSVVVRGLVQSAIDFGSSELVTLTVPAFCRSLSRLGYDVEQIGARYHSPLDGRTYAVLSMPATHAGLEMPRSEILIPAKVRSRPPA